MICSLKMKGILHNLEGSRITKSNDTLIALDSGEPNSVISCYKEENNENKPVLMLLLCMQRRMCCKLCPGVSVR